MKVIKNLPLVDAQKMREEHPETFGAPAYEDLKALAPGIWVKVSVYDERFWVEITERGQQPGTFIGRIDNDLLTDKLKYNDFIEFSENHIYQIHQ